MNARQEEYTNTQSDATNHVVLTKFNCTPKVNRYIICLTFPYGLTDGFSGGENCQTALNVLTSLPVSVYLPPLVASLLFTRCYSQSVSSPGGFSPWSSSFLLCSPPRIRQHPPSFCRQTVGPENRNCRLITAGKRKSTNSLGLTVKDVADEFTLNGNGDCVFFRRIH